MSNARGTNQNFVYVGSGNRIERFALEANGSLRRLGDTVFPGQSPGWFAYDVDESRLFIPDGLGPNLTAYRLNSESGELNLETTIPFVSHSVHLHLHKVSDGYELAGASYDHATYGRGLWTKDLANFKNRHRLRFRSDSKTHASSYDPTRRLIFVSNLGDNRIHIFRDSNTVLEKVAKIDIINPRIVHYDHQFDRLYVSTEAYSDRSYIKIYDLTDGFTGDVLLKETGSFEMALSGGDLKINHRMKYLAATVREEGKEGLWFLPLTDTGHFDPARERHFIGIPYLKPRSLQVTHNGRFYIVACDDSKNKKDLIVIRAVFDGSGRHLVGAEIVDAVKLSSAPSLANALIEVR